MAAWALVILLLPAGAQGQPGHVTIEPSHDAIPIDPIPLFGACCRPDGSCVQTTRRACLQGGGEWQGSHSSCADHPCGPQVCGGIAGIPCDPGEFCKLPDGQCCCDFQGVCTDFPQACPLIYAPVCGCDGVTYDNECFASAAGQSVDYQGPCGPHGACCLPDGTCRRLTEDECQNECGFWRGPNTLCIGHIDPSDTADEAAQVPNTELSPIQPIPIHPCPIVDFIYGACCLANTPSNVECVNTYECDCDRRGGIWQGGFTTCSDHGICTPSCCDPADEPCTNGNPCCFEGHTCCDGIWVCNGPTAEPACDPAGDRCPACCDPDAIPPCIEGATCCANGQWACNEGDGSPTCKVIGHVCEKCCDPDEEPGTHGNPFCFEGATCCADGEWHCNDADLSNTCPNGDTSRPCPQCCDPADEPCTNGNPCCFEGHTCCADGVWRCNDFDLSNTCPNGETGERCAPCCDPDLEPGVGGNPICFEGHNCCANGQWACNQGDGSPSCHPVGEVCGGFGKCCDVNGQCYDHVSQRRCEEEICGRWGGPDSHCNPTGTYPDCPIPPIFVSACCLPDDSCIVTYECDCRRQDGIWHGGHGTYVDCDQVDCAGGGIRCGNLSGVQCPDGQYCNLGEGNCCCDFPGICTDIPEVCPLVYIPVCGCDGVTYGNACEAAMAGMTIDHDGPCCAQPCGGPLAVVCPGGTYCHTDTGECGQLGCCEPRPENCIALWDPVCGCDGQTYSNSCYAAAAGVSVAHDGECEQVCGGIAGIPCPDGQYCDLGTGHCCCDFQGVCRELPEFCNLIYAPVCGCDGQTYGNACLAAAAGQSIDHDGPCEPIGRCCLIPYGCIETTEQDCRVNQCGFWAGADTHCGPGTGPGPIAVCPIIDPIFGACCLADGSCVQTYQCDCNRQGGEWRGNNTSCNAADACPPRVCGGIQGIPCPNGQFCHLPDGSCCCDFQGVCEPIPQFCPEYYQPVCGCDGVTYDNECFAFAAGQSIDHDGPCGYACHTWDDCQIFGSPLPYYCAKAPGDCDGEGVCRVQPSACPDVYDPVCGCDGQTYGNSCEAAAAGVNVAYEGECAQVCGGFIGIACPDGQFCDLPIGSCCCDFQGLCRDVPEACTAQYDPVCGCDGNTYGNACEAAMAQMSIDYVGECNR